MARRQPINTVTAAVQVMQKAAKELLPPKHIHMTKLDKPFWKSVIAEKARSEWSDHELELAALLAKTLRKLEQEDVLLDDEGSVVTTFGGHLAQNPRVRIVADMHSRAMKYRQTLGINARAKGGETRDIERRREIAKGIEANNPLEDDMLAMPPLRAVG